MTEPTTGSPDKQQATESGKPEWLRLRHEIDRLKAVNHQLCNAVENLWDEIAQDEIEWLEPETIRLAKEIHEQRSHSQEPTASGEGQSG